MSGHSLVSSQPAFQQLEAFPESAFELLEHIAQNAYQTLLQPGQPPSLSDYYLLHNNFEQRPGNQKSVIEPEFFSRDNVAATIHKLEEKFQTAASLLPGLFVENFMTACRVTTSANPQVERQILKEEQEQKIQDIAAQTPADFPVIVRGRSTKAIYEAMSDEEKCQDDRRMQINSAAQSITKIANAGEQMGILFATQYRAKGAAPA